MYDEKEIGWQLTSTYDQLPKKFYEFVSMNQVADPKFLLLNEELATNLGLDAAKLQQHGLEMLAGNRSSKYVQPIAQSYAGHQFGHLAKLGDGRAILLGVQQAKDGVKNDIQLKGAGPTPFSRNGDGRAAVGPMAREYLMSEAMHALGIPSTRALAVVKTGGKILRERFLDGAVLTRVAKSHLRVGTFEYSYHFGTDRDMNALVNYAIEELYPELKHSDNLPLALLEKVITQQAGLIAKWQLVGFIHGVMNTDNMTISGETIDYGPCAFMDVYNPATVFSSIDTTGRYAYQNQPAIGEWNLARLTETLMPLLHEDEEQALEIAQQALTKYRPQFEQNWYIGMCQKLALDEKHAESGKLIKELLALMEKFEADYTNTFIALTTQEFEKELLFQTRPFKDWLENWRAAVDYDKQSASITEKMRAYNPAIIPRNYYVEEALREMTKNNDKEPYLKLLKALQDPYAYTELQKAYQYPENFDTPYQTYCGT